MFAENGVQYSKIQALYSLLFYFVHVWERAGILLARKVLPALPNSAFEDKGCIGRQWKFERLLKKLQVICFQWSVFCSLNSIEHLHSLCEGGFLMKTFLLAEWCSCLLAVKPRGVLGSGSAVPHLLPYSSLQIHQNETNLLRTKSAI